MDKLSLASGAKFPVLNLACLDRSSPQAVKEIAFRAFSKGCLRAADIRVPCPAIETKIVSVVLHMPPSSMAECFAYHSQTIVVLPCKLILAAPSWGSNNDIFLAIVFLSIVLATINMIIWPLNGSIQKFRII